MTPDELTTVLRQNAGNNPARSAAVELLAWHEYWIRRMAFYPDKHHVDRHGDVDWVELANAVVRDEFHASTSELKILSIACSLVGTLAVDLRDCATGLGPAHLRRVLAAVAQAAGYPEVFPA